MAQKINKNGQWKSDALELLSTELSKLLPCREKLQAKYRKEVENNQRFKNEYKKAKLTLSAINRKTATQPEKNKTDNTATLSKHVVLPLKVEVAQSCLRKSTVNLHLLRFNNYCIKQRIIYLRKAYAFLHSRKQTQTNSLALRNKQDVIRYFRQCDKNFPLIALPNHSKKH